MTDIGWETEQFERHRAHLEAVAYRMLGSVSEAEDAVQEAWLRLGRSRQEAIHNVRAWLTTIVGRVCIDMLRARRSRREEYVGAWVPEPIVEADEETDPERQALMADTVGLALLVVLEALSPNERVAYVLHDMFGVPFAEIAEIIDRGPGATRQLASRARRRVRGAVPRSDGDPAQQRQAVAAFLAASRAGDFEGLVAVLDPGVVFRADGGREVEQELTGAAEVAGKFASLGPYFASRCHLARVNGQAGLVLATGEGMVGVVGFTMTDGRIATIDLVLGPGGPGGLEGLGDALGPGRSPEGGAGQGSAAQRIVSQALSWPGVDRARGHLGSVGFYLGGRELGHVHGGAVADVPVLPEPPDQPGQDRAAPGGQEPGWVSVSLDTEDGLRHALALLRANYRRARASGA